jgi:hypothetical protein
VCRATREEEHALSIVSEGPLSPKKCDTRAARIDVAPPVMLCSPAGHGSLEGHLPPTQNEHKGSGSQERASLRGREDRAD